MTRAREVSIAQPSRQKERGSILNLINFLLRHPRLVFGVPAFFAVVAGVFSLVRSPGYTAESKFATQKGASGNARFAGLAAQFGVNLESSNAIESPDFYMELLTSQHLLRDAANTSYSFRDPETNRVLTGNLVQLYGIKAPSADAALRAAALRLRSDISMFPNVRSGLITLRTGAPWGGLAVALNQRLLELVNAFNLQTRQTQASHERQFVDERLNVAQNELTAAETALKQFNQDNRIAGSPQLQFEQQRLQRRVELRQQVYVSLAQAYEQARIDEVRNTPVITVVEPPSGTATRRGGGAITNALLGLFAGLVVGIIMALAGEYFGREAAEDPQAAAELRRKIMFWRRRRLAPSRAPARVEASHHTAHEEG